MAVEKMSQDEMQADNESVQSAPTQTNLFFHDGYTLISNFQSNRNICFGSPERMTFGTEPRIFGSNPQISINSIDVRKLVLRNRLIPDFQQIATTDIHTQFQLAQAAFENLSDAYRRLTQDLKLQSTSPLQNDHKILGALEDEFGIYISHKEDILSILENNSHLPNLLGHIFSDLVTLLTDEAYLELKSDGERNPSMVVSVWLDDASVDLRQILDRVQAHNNKAILAVEPGLFLVESYEPPQALAS